MTQCHLDANESRLERGKRALARIDGEAGQNVISALADIAPDFATYVFEFPFGDIYSRPGLSVRDREIAAIASLAAMGNATPQLKVHIEAGDHGNIDANGCLCGVSRSVEWSFRGQGSLRCQAELGY
jgi:4-carboxymuconolactone decarboxylase